MIIRTKKTKDIVKQIVEHSVKKLKTKHLRERIFVSTGSTHFNLACSDRYSGAFSLGSMENIVGDSSSGKSIAALSIIAEAAHNPIFDKYKLIYDEPECANNFNIGKLFGKVTEARLQAPRYDKNGEAMWSETIQDFHHNVMRFLNGNQPVIYILDSFDALTSNEEITKVEEAVAAVEKGNKPKGSYGMEKAKIASQILRMIIGKLKRTDSLLIIISQTRDNIDPMSFASKTRSGGRALKFYASHEIWTAIAGTIKHKDTKVGIICSGKITKNKLTGKLREFKFPIYYSYGIDDISSCIDFLVSKKYWHKNGNKIKAKGIAESMVMKKLVTHIEQKGLERKLKKLVKKVWEKDEAELQLERKSKYD